MVKFFAFGLALAALIGCSASDDASADSALAAIDDPCATAADCAAPGAECIEFEGALRCEAFDCTLDADCGAGAQCLNGECWRACGSPADCAADDWTCRPLNLEGGTTPGSYCAPPCRLYGCSVDGFTYTCGTDSYGATTEFDYGANPSDPTVVTDVNYSNGHAVHCSGSVQSGSCSDDSGASCSW